MQSFKCVQLCQMTGLGIFFEVLNFHILPPGNQL